jgi:hypothetical protein
MKRFLIVLLLACLLAGTAAAFTTEACTDWAGCQVVETYKDFVTTGRSDTTNFDMRIQEVNPNPALVDDDKNPSLIWPYCQPQEFFVEYKPDTGLVTFWTTNKEITYGYDPGKVFEYLVIMAKGDANSNSATLTGLKLNGADLGSGTISDGATKTGMIVYLTDEEQADGFKVTGSVNLCWNTAGHPQESPGFHVMAMKTHEPEPPVSVPEFPTILAPILSLTGIAIAVIIIKSDPNH